MSIQVINTTEVGQGLELTGGEIKAKIDPAEGNALTVSEAGLKVVVPEAEQVEVPTALTDATIDGNTITFPKSNGTNTTVQLPALPVDVHVTGLEFAQDGTVTLTVAGADPITTNLTGEVVGKSLLNAPQGVKNDLAAMFAPLILEKLGKNELLRVNGERMGYLLTGEVAEQPANASA